MAKSKYPKCSEFEQGIMKHLDKVGYDHFASLQVRFRCAKQRLMASLNTLWKMDAITRTRKGLYFSTSWLSENPEEKAAIETALKTIIV